MPSDTFTHTTRVTADVARITSSLHDADTWRGIGPIDEIWEATHDGARLASFRWSARAAGRIWTGTAEAVEGAPGDAITLRLRSPEVSGTLSVTLDGTGDGTLLRVTLDARSTGVLAGMFWSVIADALRGGFAGQVEEFGGRF